jgi:hypothetical protein
VTLRKPSNYSKLAQYSNAPIRNLAECIITTDSDLDPAVLSTSISADAHARLP